VNRALPFIAALLLLSGCLDSFVGAECAEGFAESGGVCVPTDAATDSGMPDTGLDGSMDADAGDASPDASDSSMDASDSSTDGGDGSMGDGGAGCDLGETLCGMDCVRTGSDPMHCGGCDMACPGMEVCSGGSCVPTCLAPEELCDGRCFDPSMSTDPEHCGSCGNRCRSGLCIDGMCADATAGHVVLIGHDYQSSRRGMQRIAGNSVFLASGVDVEVVVFRGSATMAQVRGIDRAIDRVATERGRAWTKIGTTRDELLALLDGADVFLLYPQPDGTDMELTSFGASVRTGFRTFLRRGGVIVVFDTPSMTNAGTWQFLTGAALIDVTSQTEITGDAVMVSAPGDAIALGVDLMYAAERQSVRYEAMAPVVVSHADGPVVLHEVPVP